MEELSRTLERRRTVVDSTAFHFENEPSIRKGSLGAEAWGTMSVMQFREHAASELEEDVENGAQHSSLSSALTGSRAADGRMGADDPAKKDKLHRRPSVNFAHKAEDRVMSPESGRQMLAKLFEKERLERHAAITTVRHELQNEFTQELQGVREVLQELQNVREAWQGGKTLKMQDAMTRNALQGTSVRARQDGYDVHFLAECCEEATTAMKSEALQRKKAHASLETRVAESEASIATLVWDVAKLSKLLGSSECVTLMSPPAAHSLPNPNRRSSEIVSPSNQRASLPARLKPRMPQGVAGRAMNSSAR